MTKELEDCDAMSQKARKVSNPEGVGGARVVKTELRLTYSNNCKQTGDLLRRLVTSCETPET